jgi:hypothetical protein
MHLLDGWSSTCCSEQIRARQKFRGYGKVPEAPEQNERPNVGGRLQAINIRVFVAALLTPPPLPPFRVICNNTKNDDTGDDGTSGNSNAIGLFRCFGRKTVAYGALGGGSNKKE